MTAKKPCPTEKAPDVTREITTTRGNMRFKTALLEHWFLLVALLGIYAIPLAAAEVQPSNPPERTQCKFPEVTVEYSSMRMDGRKIFGDVVPYGQAWATGDRRSPTLVASVNLMMGGKEVPAGRYSLSTIPNPDRWTMVVKTIPGKNNPTGTDEVARVDLLVRRLHAPLESFTISFDQWRGGCVLNLRWEETEASVLLAEKK